MGEGLKVTIPPGLTATELILADSRYPTEVRAQIEADQAGIAEDIEDKANEEAQRLAEANSTGWTYPFSHRPDQRSDSQASHADRPRVLLSGEALLAQVQLAELIADRAEAEAEAVAQWIRVSVGVNDSIKGLQAELVITARQMKLTAALYGRNSAEFAALRITQDQLRNQLIPGPA